MLTPTPDRCTPQVVGACLVTALAFVAAYGHAPLYYSNQNQYFLHGVANAEGPPLAEDWLARTDDPAPVFTALVEYSVRHLDPAAFHAYQAVMLGTYAVALLGLFDALVGRALAARRWPVFAALLVLSHSAAARWASYRLLGQDYPWYFQAGVAGQYTLGSMLQPSVFGVLLVLAVCLFARGRPFSAAACVGAATVFHATYLLPGAMLTGGFVVGLLWQGQNRQALMTGGLALVLALPTVAYSTYTFAPTSPGTFAEAQDILVNVRIPHHARPDLWLDPVAAVQILWMVVGLALARGSRLVVPLSVAFALAVALTLVQAGTGSRTLALLFPWRVSAVLVPVATAVVLARLAALPRPWLENWVAWLTSTAVLVLLATAGLWVSLGRHAFHVAREEEEVLAFVRRTRQPGEVYLLPVRIPELAKTTRGSLSSDFKPLPDKRQDTRVIPVDLQRFRLHAGAPIYIDFKSIPYKDTDVLHWRDRLLFADSVRRQIEEGRVAEVLPELRRRGVTHLLVPRAQQLHDPDLQLVHLDDHYRVYRLGP